MKADKKASKNTFSVIFVIQKGKCRPDGKAPIVARITVNGEMVHFSTKMYIEPERWLPLEYKTKGQTHEEQGRTRQTLWRAVQMLTQKLCCQTIHDCPKVVPLHYESE